MAPPAFRPRLPPMLLLSPPLAAAVLASLLCRAEAGSVLEPGGSGSGGGSPANGTCGGSYKCKEGILLPIWFPENPSLGDKVARAIVYFVALVYMFLGVSIIADRFMASIEVITSQEREVIIRRANGETTRATVRVWNETVSNLTLMALGSSAPEILLSIIEVVGHEFKAGELGPSTIVGSAAFNMFVIIGLCVYVIPDGESRKIKHLRVFFVTATWSIFAYIWLYLILAVISPGIVEVWESLVTLMFFPVCVMLAWVADRRLLFYKYMYKKYRTKRHGIIIETEGERPKAGIEMDGKVIGSGGGGSGGSGGGGDDSTVDGGALVLPESNDADESRREMIRILKELKQKYPEKDMDQLVEMANYQALIQQQKSRAFYRIQATRMMTGSGNILKKHAADQARRASSLHSVSVAEQTDEHTTKIHYEPCSYICLENCGSCALSVVRRDGDLANVVYVRYKTEDGTAKAGSDYEYSEGTLVFKAGETQKEINVGIIDDDIFEEDEHFFVRLYDVHVSPALDSTFEQNHGGLAGVGAAAAAAFPAVRLVPPYVATVTIFDDDHAGIFTFEDKMAHVSESVGIMEVRVLRTSGARGTVVVPYKTVEGTAKGSGEDFEDTYGELEFQNDETIKTIHIKITDDEEYEKQDNFFLVLGEPRWIDQGTTAMLLKEPGELVRTGGMFKGHPLYRKIQSRENIISAAIVNFSEDGERKPLSVEEQEAKRIAEMGRPVLGEHPRMEVIIEESYEFKSTVDKLIKKTNLALVVGTHSWREQFLDALTVSAGDEDEDDESGEEKLPSCFDYVMHFLSVFWKVLFAFVPPTEYFNGWACFLVSIFMIGLLTAFIGDLASHFGCTIGLKDSVTAVVFVALGTSVPDTFASKVSATQDQYADASIGNVTGSNGVNVFLGIGIAWSIAAIYWWTQNEPFRVDPGTLAFSVTLFTVFAFVCVAVLLYRRRPSVGGELGGGRTGKILTSGLFFSLWLLYILFSGLEAYCHIKAF
uniref:Sodium/calcium exchanger 3-like isoform X2 n=1 Tax=Petromyzon marinus TaxID=7757 RepID=A0AAJ7TJ61_PETMA|nr:sodium/calcium exchanger 3-like isoform X2 [Petromyzon marinus]